MSNAKFDRAGQAIVTRYKGPTGARGACIVASAWASSMRVPYPHHLHQDDKHRHAAMTLAKALEWPIDGWIEAGMPDGESKVFVCAPKQAQAIANKEQEIAS